MTKTLKILLSISILCATSSAFADVGSFLQQAADTTAQVSNAVNGPTKVTIADLGSSKKYKGTTVEVSGSVTELRCNKSGNYTVVLTDGSNKVRCISKELPDVKLKEKVTVTGTYNGRKVKASNIESADSIL
jgi:hypothetical protein